MIRRAKNEYLIRSLDHTLDVLEALSRSTEEMGLAQVARQVGLHKNSVFRLMATLENRGFVERNPSTGNYLLGLRAFECGYAYLHHASLAAAARPILLRLAALLAENACLAVLRDGHIFYQEEVVAERSVRVIPRQGTRIPLGFSAVGKAFLAHLPESDLARLLESAPACGPAGAPRSPASLRAELAQVRRRGYVVDKGGWEAGVTGAAAPAFDFHGKVAGVLYIFAPSYRFSGASLEKAARELREAAEEVSRRLGYFIGMQPPASA